MTNWTRKDRKNLLIQVNEGYGYECLTPESDLLDDKVLEVEREGQEGEKDVGGC